MPKKCLRACMGIPCVATGSVMFSFIRLSCFSWHDPSTISCSMSGSSTIQGESPGSACQVPHPRSHPKALPCNINGCALSPLPVQTQVAMINRITAVMWPTVTKAVMTEVMKQVKVQLQTQVFEKVGEPGAGAGLRLCMQQSTLTDSAACLERLL